MLSKAGYSSYFCIHQELGKPYVKGAEFVIMNGKQMMSKVKVVGLFSITVFFTMLSCGKDSPSQEEIEIVEEDQNSDTDTDVEPDPVFSICRAEGENPGPDGDRIYFYTELPGVPANTQDVDVNTTGETKTSEIDDRTCHYNYSQIEMEGNMYGRYQLLAGSSTDNFQPRIERSSRVINETGAGTFVSILGTVRIFEAGYVNDNRSATAVGDENGTYIIQAKGKDTIGNGSPDPAIALLLVKPTDSTQTRFRFYLEIITERGGSGENGRDIVDLNFEVDKAEPAKVTMTNEFVNEDNVKKHYVRVGLNETTTSFEIPNPESGTQVKLRFGAYRCKGGNADIRWREDVTQIYNAVP